MELELDLKIIFISKIKKNTRRYAKRQITWFKKYNNALSFPADTEAKVIYELLTS